MSSLSRKFSEYVKSPAYLDTREIVFIDSRIASCENLIQQAAPEVRVIVLGLLADGIEAITETLNSSFCRRVYLVGSGLPGCIYLGKTELSQNTLIQHESRLQSWFSRVDSDLEPPQLHLCGCNVLAGDVGAEFLTKLNRMTGAVISASKNVYSSRVFN